MRRLLTLTLLMTIACGGGDESDDDSGVDPDVPLDSGRVRIGTTMGDIVVELAVDDAPVTAANFLTYVDSGFFDGDDDNGATIFHRVMDDFMIQGGGFTASGTQKTTEDPIDLEVGTGLRNLRGTLAMARTNDPDSATSQFFINHKDNAFLDSTGPGTGYAVFGEVIEGMDVVDAIATTPVDDPGGQAPRPLTDVEITDCERE